MTDNEIVKALECCDGTLGGCEQCPNYNNRYCCKIKQAALDLINRQKAEIEMLSDVVICLQHHGRKLCELEAEMINNIKSEAIKEFAERLKKKATCFLGAVSVEDINSLVEEMTEETNNAE